MNNAANLGITFTAFTQNNFSSVGRHPVMIIHPYVQDLYRSGLQSFTARDERRLLCSLIVSI
jgi:hypothetical protein